MTIRVGPNPVSLVSLKKKKGKLDAETDTQREEDRTRGRGQVCDWRDAWTRLRTPGIAGVRRGKKNSSLRANQKSMANTMILDL